ncbi:hypothetical protein JYU34_014043, partial [Plutella xylostella]
MYPTVPRVKSHRRPGQPGNFRGNIPEQRRARPAPRAPAGGKLHMTVSGTLRHINNRLQPVDIEIYRSLQGLALAMIVSTRAPTALALAVSPAARAGALARK